MADVGDGSVIGAVSVVVKPVLPLSVAVGDRAVVKKALQQPSGAQDMVAAQ